MIVIFNLNSYLGGGETLAFRYAKYLHHKQIDYCIITSNASDCYIGKQSLQNGLNCFFWPIFNDSLPYMSNFDKQVIKDWLNEIFVDKNLNVLTFCFRDLYNASFFFPKIKCKDCRITTGIYHPEDVFYLSSYSFFKNNIIDFNRKLAKRLTKLFSIIYMNEYSYEITVGDNTNRNQIIIPIPIELEVINYQNKYTDITNIKIICISRFVEFKIGAVMAIIKFAQKNKKIHLDLIGYGFFEFYIRLYIYIYNIKNINLIGKVDPGKLSQYILSADIGYAQGTSIMEISKFGIPVIIAPYSNFRDIFNSSFKCMGIFGEKNSYEYGDRRYDGSDLYELIDDAYKRIIENYQFYVGKSKNHVQKFSSELIFQKISNVVLNSSFKGFVGHEKTPKAPLIKRFVKYIIKLF
jgi:hypothetical protein